MAVLDDLLTLAQRAHSVRSDVGVEDVKALLVGCQAMQHTSAGPATARRTIAIVRDGLIWRPGLALSDTERHAESDSLAHPRPGAAGRHPKAGTDDADAGRHE